jgi:hypothetical protein
MDELEFLLVAWVLLTTWGAISTLQTTATRNEKLFWLGVLMMPALGFLGWYVLGPGSKSLPGFERNA